MFRLHHAARSLKTRPSCHLRPVLSSSSGRCMSSASGPTQAGKIAGTRPQMVEMKAGEGKSWCSCGKSSKQPWCDGTHKGSGFKPFRFKAEEDGTKALCMCKRSKNPPFCDGSHNNIATKPLPVALEANKDYFWCACGHSKNQPFCDGSHAGTAFSPMKFTADKDGKRSMCACKETQSPPYCDGSHRKIQKDEAATSATSKVAQWHRVAGKDDITDTSRAVAVKAGATELALVRSGDTFYAMDGICPHQGGPLSEGTVSTGADGGIQLRCPWHGWDFSVKDGKNADPKESGIKTYPVEVRADGGVYVQVEEAEKIQPPTVSDLMTKTFVNWGLRDVFGMVGHSNLGLADAIRKQVEAGKMSFYGIRHEGAAAFAASAYAKLTGKPAAALTIAGPGATNLLTGLWDAHVDQAPVLALTGQVQTQVLGPGAFQEIDVASAFSAVSKFSQTVLSSSRHSELASLAMKNALVKRNVSHLIFPDEVQDLTAPEEAVAGSPDGRLGDRAVRPSQAAVDAAVGRIVQSKRPAIIVGYGAVGAMREVTALAEAINAPILTTFKGKGQIEDSHPLSAGVLGRSGIPVASSSMRDADLLIVFGATFAVHTGISSDKPIIQVDYDPMALGKFHSVEVPVLGEIAFAAAAFTEGVAGKTKTVDQRAELKTKWAEWRAEKARRRDALSDKGLASASVFESMGNIVPENAVLALDVGNNTYSFGRYFESKRGQRVLMSGYLGSIGFSFPAAMGAWAATQSQDEYKHHRVFSVSGDGGFGQYMTEFTTAVKYNMNITHVLLNNSELGKISLEQRVGKYKVWQTGLVNPNFAEYARSCGGLGLRVERQADLDGALQEAAAYEGPALVEVVTDASLV